MANPMTTNITPAELLELANDWDACAIKDEDDAKISFALRELAAIKAQQPNELDEALCSANEMCRSAAEIARRNGAGTNWPLFLARLTESCVLQARVIHGHEVREDSATATAKVFKLRDEQQPSGAQAGLVGRMAEGIRWAHVRLRAIGANSRWMDGETMMSRLAALLAEYDASPLPGDGEKQILLDWIEGVLVRNPSEVAYRARNVARNLCGHPSPLPASEPEQPK